ncbi:hypothetical protein ACLOJK_015825 [Asimina triloba]
MTLFRMLQSVEKMSSALEELKKLHLNSKEQRKEDDECSRFVIAKEAGIAEVDTLKSGVDLKSKSFRRWMKALLGFLVLALITLAFLKRGVPFCLEKVLMPIMKWEATAFGRPVLALVLVASLSFFPIFLIPSGPSMWLAGMIFGYGLGFLIIMAGTAVGMIGPYLIGSLFRDRLHVRQFGFRLTDFCCLTTESEFIIGFSLLTFCIGIIEMDEEMAPEIICG